MRLAYVISKHTNPNSNYKLHLINRNYLGYDEILCGTKSFSLEFTNAPKPTCQKCLKWLEWLGLSTDKELRCIK